MTRINCVPVEELHYKHLVAEYRELPRVFALARITKRAPAQYTLGTGHVLFFYDKLGWLYARQWQLYDEMKRRGYNPSFNPKTLHEDYGWRKRHLWYDWTPTPEAIALNRQRIKERSPWIK